MKKFVTVFLLTLSVLAFSQEKKALYIKGNALLIPIGILNAGLEYQLSNKYTLQGDFLISPWKSFAGNHLQLYLGHIEGRYYFDQAFKHWYLGLNAGAGVFDITKNETYRSKNEYQRGFNLMLGATFGYQFQVNEKLNIDLFLGGGTSQAFYHGYDADTNERYDGEEGFNKSGEFLPYRGGVMISYKLR